MKIDLKWLLQKGGHIVPALVFQCQIDLETQLMYCAIGIYCDATKIKIVIYFKSNNLRK